MKDRAFEYAPGDQEVYEWMPVQETPGALQVVYGAGKGCADARRLRRCGNAGPT